MTRHLLVIGGQRCGTTYLHTLLEAHPDVAMARPARPEPKVFLSDELAGRGRDWYRRTYFAHATNETVLGEKSTSYLEDHVAPGRARAVLGEAHIVVQLRDPVSRAVSNWRFSTTNGMEDRPLEGALNDALEGRQRDWDRGITSVSPYAYLERGRYLDDLEPWLAEFGERVHVRFLEEVVAGVATARDLYRAIGVDPDVDPSAEGTPVNASGGDTPALDDNLVRRLRAYYRDADERLSARLGRPLPWPVG